jgi:hypothetical protein
MASRRSPAERAAARRVAKLTALQAQLRIELEGVAPLVWRRILVPENITLPKLHGALLHAMGWLGGHVHEYEIARLRYGLPDPDWPDPELNDERRVRLKPLIETGLRRFVYIYDLGDNWEHIVTVEDLVVPAPNLPPVRCLAGENACPPEDVGSADGYASFLEIIGDPAHEEYAHMLKWVGGSFDPTAFSLDDINERLAEIKA